MPRVGVFLFATAALAARAAAQGPGTWEAHAPMGFARQEHGSARVGGAVWVAGGLQSGFPFTATDTVERYDVAGGAWSFGPPLPDPRDHHVVAAHGGRVFVIGGYAGDFAARDTVWCLDPAVGVWEPRAPMPEARGACWGVTLGDRIYVFGGEDAAGTARASTFVYDPVADAWSVGADMPTAREHLVAAALDGFVYVLGGRVGAALDANERYDPATDSWTVRAPMPTARSAMACAAFCGRVYAMGGELPVLHVVNESYDPGTDTWATHAPMTIPRHGVGAVALDDRILVPGGGIVQGLLPTTAVDAFVPDVGVTVHCTAKTNSLGCTPQVAAAGVPSASSGLPFDVTATGVIGLKNGLFFYGLSGPTSVPFQGGTLCAVPPLRRTPLQNAGSTTPTDCTGSYAFDFNAWLAGGNDPAVAPGQDVNGQFWSRDPAHPDGTGVGLTDAVGFPVCP